MMMMMSSSQNQKAQEAKTVQGISLQSKSMRIRDKVTHEVNEENTRQVNTISETVN